MLLLEGSNKVGGRMREEVFCGQVIELGANWITGLVGEDGAVNPIYALAKELGLFG